MSYSAYYILMNIAPVFSYPWPYSAGILLTPLEISSLMLNCSF